MEANRTRACRASWAPQLLSCPLEIPLYPRVLELVFTCLGPLAGQCRSAVQITGQGLGRQPVASPDARHPQYTVVHVHSLLYLLIHKPGVPYTRFLSCAARELFMGSHNTRLRQSMTGDPFPRIRSLERTTLKDPTGCRTGRPARHPRDRCRTPLPRRNRRRGRRPRSPSQAHETCEPGA